MVGYYSAKNSAGQEHSRNCMLGVGLKSKCRNKTNNVNLFGMVAYGIIVGDNSAINIVLTRSMTRHTWV